MIKYRSAEAFLHEILEVVMDICAKWKQLGTALKVKQCTIERFDRDYRQCEEALIEVIKEWQKSTDKDVSWKGLAKALASKIVGEEKLAGEIEKKYCQKAHTGEVPPQLKPPQPAEQPRHMLSVSAHKSEIFLKHLALVGERTMFPKYQRRFSELYKYSIAHPKEFWEEVASCLYWRKSPFNAVCKPSEGSVLFCGGKINVCENCLDQHASVKPNEPALIYDFQGEILTKSYLQLLNETCQVSNVLKSKHVQKGDYVVVYMPTTPIAVACILACARIGAIQCVLYSCTNLNLKQSIEDVAPKVILTATNCLQNVRDALPKESSVEVIVASEANAKQEPNFTDSVNYYCLEKEMRCQPTECAAEPMDGEDELFIVYTSGTAGEPRGIVHTQAGCLLWAAYTLEYIFDYRSGDVFGCMADIGWIAGLSYSVFGPLFLGGCTLIYEGTKRGTEVDIDCYWKKIEKMKLTHLVTIPSVMSELKHKRKNKIAYDLSSLRVIILLGETVRDDVLEWTCNVVGRKKCLVIDTWGQTELGGVGLVRWWAEKAHIPSHYPEEHNFAFFGIEPYLAHSRLMKGKSVGALYLKNACLPGMARRVVNMRREEFRERYFTLDSGPQPVCGPRDHYFCTTDLAERENGGYRITVRAADTVRIKGSWIYTPSITPKPETDVDQRIDSISVVAYKSNEETEEAVVQCNIVLKPGEHMTNSERNEVVVRVIEKVKNSTTNVGQVKGRVMEAWEVPRTANGKVKSGPG